jgi:hypothetical protein
MARDPKLFIRFMTLSKMTEVVDSMRGIFGLLVHLRTLQQCAGEVVKGSRDVWVRSYPVSEYRFNKMKNSLVEVILLI